MFYDVKFCCDSTLKDLIGICARVLLPTQIYIIIDKKNVQSYSVRIISSHSFYWRIWISVIFHLK